MCTQPGTITVNGSTFPAKCRKCEECASHRRRHLLGKVLAEQQIAKEVWFSTYTYGGGYTNDAAYLLRYKHMQDTFKLMRKAGHRFRYLVVGEFGEEGERAHWHALIFWESEPPKMPMGERTPEEGDGFWTFGYVQHEYPRSKTGVGAYCMKYMEKNNTWYKKNIRKSIALGDGYLLELAREHARAGLPLFASGNTFVIKEQSERSRSGAQFFYPVERGTGTHQRMLKAWLDEWVLKHPDMPLKTSEDVSEFLELVWEEIDDQSERIQVFMEKHYGFGPSEPQSRVVMAYHTMPGTPGVFVRLRSIAIELGMLNPEGGEIWLANLSESHGVRAELDARSLPPDVILAAQSALKKPEISARLSAMRRFSQNRKQRRLENRARLQKIKAAT